MLNNKNANRNGWRFVVERKTRLELATPTYWLGLLKWRFLLVGKESGHKKWHLFMIMYKNVVLQGIRWLRHQMLPTELFLAYKDRKSSPESYLCEVIMT